MKTREFGDQVLGYPVGEIILLGIAAHVVEGQYRQRGPMRRGIRGRRRRGVVRSTDSYVKGAHRLGDVFQRLLARRLVGEAELAPDAVMHGSGDADAAGLTHLLQPRRDVDAVAEDVVALDHDVAEVNADAEFQPAVLCPRGVAPTQIVLDLGGAGDGVGDRGELGQQRVARRADDAPGAALDARGHGRPVFGERAQRRLLVSPHEAGIARGIGGENGDQAALYDFRFHETDRC